MNILTVFFIVIFYAVFFDLINYDKSSNPDIYNYINNFESKNWSYDIGFESYQSFLRDTLGFDFDSFWNVSLILIMFLFAFSGFRYYQFPFFIVNYFFLAQAFGTQIRFFIASLLFIFAINYSKGLVRFTVLVLASLFHYGVFILLACFLLSNFLTTRKSAIVKYARYILFFSVFLYFISSTIVAFILPYTRFSYYLGSHYMEAKSTVSFLYALISLVLLFLFYKKNESDDRILNFTLLILFLVVCTSSIAVLSGRLLLVYMILEVSVSKLLFNLDKRFYFILLVLVILKSLPSFFVFLNNLF